MRSSTCALCPLARLRNASDALLSCSPARSLRRLPRPLARRPSMLPLDDTVRVAPGAARLARLRHVHVPFRPFRLSLSFTAVSFPLVLHFDRLPSDDPRPDPVLLVAPATASSPRSSFGPWRADPASRARPPPELDGTQGPHGQGGPPPRQEARGRLPARPVRVVHGHRPLGRLVVLPGQGARRPRRRRRRDGAQARAEHAQRA